MAFLVGALALTAVGQLSFKAGTTRGTTSMVIGGLVALGLAMVSTLFALRSLEIGFVFMATGITHVLVMVGSRWLLAEEIPFERWLGAATIVGGVILYGTASL